MNKNFLFLTILVFILCYLPVTVFAKPNQEEQARIAREEQILQLLEKYKTDRNKIEISNKILAIDQFNIIANCWVGINARRAKHDNCKAYKHFKIVVNQGGSCKLEPKLDNIISLYEEECKDQVVIPNGTEMKITHLRKRKLSQMSLKELKEYYYAPKEDAKSSFLHKFEQDILLGEMYNRFSEDIEVICLMAQKAKTDHEVCSMYNFLKTIRSHDKDCSSIANSNLPKSEIMDKYIDMYKSHCE